MSFNGSGTYSLPSGNPVVSGTAISTAWSNTTLADVATALNHTLCRDGQAVPTANLPMGGWKLTGLAAGSAAGDSLRYEQLSGMAKLLSTTAVGALSTTGTTYIDLVSSTVTTTRAGSKLRVVYVDSCAKVTNGGTCFLKFLEQTNLFAETYYSFAYGGYNNTVSPAFQTPAYTNAGTSVAIKLQWKRDTAGEVSTWGYGALEVWEVFA